MPKAAKLPSGMWRVRIFDHKDAKGVKHYKSFTADTKKEAEFLAVNYNRIKAAEKNMDITLSEAFERYINARAAVLSPSSVRTYDRLARNQFASLRGERINRITNEMVQRAVNAESRKIAPKTLSNAYGFLKSVLSEYAPDLRLNVKLPQKKKKEIYIPTHEEIKAILDSTKQTELGIAVLLGAGLGLRIGEVVALRWENVNLKNKKIHIVESIAKDKNNQSIVKSPKTLSGNRTLTIPSTMLAELAQWQKANAGAEYVINGLTAGALFKRFSVKLAELNIPHFRFHDLRHYNASVLLAMGVPDKYAQERLGHATSVMLKTVYQHILSEKERQVDADFDDKFDRYF